MMKHPFIGLCAGIVILLLVSVRSGAQSFDEAFELYQQEQYDEALEMFLELDPDDEETLLFTGKSYLSLGEYLKAGYYLRQVTESRNSSLSGEAFYTLALTEFRLKNFGNSLEILKALSTRDYETGIQRRASVFYNQLLRYLTNRQRYEVFWQSVDPGLRFDLVRSSVGRTEYAVLQAMLAELENMSDLLGNHSQIQEIRDEIGSPETYRIRSTRTPAPEGTLYPVGVVLPSFETDEPEFAISRNLYFGITLAAEEFNVRNPERKVFLRFRDSHAEPDSISGALNSLIWNERVDAVIGPLFSETAALMSQLAEEYEVPLLTPLANSDSINTGHHYTFQLNPTFSVHGKQMARFAVEELNLDTLAVMVESNSLGQSSARSFRREAEQLGAHVAYYIEEDFSSMGYDLSEMTQVFTRDSVLVDSLGYVPVEGIYAPFTGQAAPTLINLLMTDLEAMGAHLPVMGSAEWRNARYTRAQQENFSIYFSEGFSVELPDTADTEGEYFTEDFINRFGFEPDPFARLGYDTATYLFASLERAGNPQVLKQVLRSSPEYRGLALQIHFDGTQVNRRAQIIPLTERAAEQMYSEP